MYNWFTLLYSRKQHNIENQLCCVCASSCPTLCDLMSCSPPGSSVHGIFQARILEWAAISSSRGSFLPRVQTHISCVSCTSRWILSHYATWEAPSKGVKLSPLTGTLLLSSADHCHVGQGVGKLSPLTGTPVTQLSWSPPCGTRGWERSRQDFLREAAFWIFMLAANLKT